MLCRGEHFRSGVGHENRVLELCGELVVGSPHGPVVELVDHCLPSALANHGLDREAHPGANDLRSGFGAFEPEVRNARLLVKIATDAVTLKVSYDFVALLLGVVVNRSADVADITKGLDGVDSDPQTIKGYLHQPPSFIADVANGERFGLVAMPTINQRRDVDVDDVAVTQFTLIGDTVTDNLIDTDA